MALNDLIDNIPNDIKDLPHAVSILKEEEVEVYLANITIFFNKYTTDIEVSQFSQKMTDLLLEYNKHITHIRTKIDTIFGNIKNMEKLKDKLRQYIEGTFQCIKINMNNPDFEIILPIDTFSDDKLQKLFEKSIICEIILNEELEWRKILNEHSTIENKHKYIAELDNNISLAKQEIHKHINTIHRIYIIKNKINQIKRYKIDFSILKDIYHKYEINMSDCYSSSFFDMEPLNVDVAPIVDVPVVDVPVVDVAPIVDVPMVDVPMVDVAPIVDVPIVDVPVVDVPMVDVPVPTVPRAMTPPPALEYFMNEDKQLTEKIVSTLPTKIITVTSMTKTAPVDIILERFCMHGNKCKHMNNPVPCGYNHTVIGIPISNRNSQNKIAKGTEIPKEFCKYEKPWERIRCPNINCTSVHSIGRVSFMLKYKTEKKDVSHDMPARPFMHSNSERERSAIHVRSRSPSPVRSNSSFRAGPRTPSGSPPPNRIQTLEQIKASYETNNNDRKRKYDETQYNIPFQYQFQMPMMMSPIMMQPMMPTSNDLRQVIENKRRQ